MRINQHQRYDFGTCFVEIHQIISGNRAAPVGRKRQKEVRTRSFHGTCHFQTAFGAAAELGNADQRPLVGVFHAEFIEFVHLVNSQDVVLAVAGSKKDHLEVVGDLEIDHFGNGILINGVIADHKRCGNGTNRPGQSGTDFLP